MRKRKVAPHFFARIPGKKITKTQVFTSQSRQALLHIFTRRSRSSLKHRSDLLVKTLHFIPLVKAFRYRFTCEVAACGGRMCLCLQRTLRCLKYIQLYYRQNPHKVLYRKQWLPGSGVPPPPGSLRASPLRVAPGVSAEASAQEEGRRLVAA